MFAVAVAAGFIGSMLGLGGGVIIIPALTLLFGRDMHEAIAISAVTVIATSISAASVHIREGLVNIRLAFFLELSAVPGAIAGSRLGLWANPAYLQGIFAVLLFYTACHMLRSGGGDTNGCGALCEDDRDHPETVTFADKATGELSSYRPKAMALGLAASLAAGVISGLLGVGAGFVKVPIMNLMMAVPLKAAIATSNYRAGISTTATAMIYFMHGYVKPMVVAPCAIGVLLGAQMGSHFCVRARSSVLRLAFVILLVYISVQMLLRAIGGK